MEKEHYKAQSKSIQDQISYFKNQAIELDLKYIEENKPFNIGDRIKNERHNEFGFVYGFEIGYDSEVRPKAYKEKKDGTSSKFNLYIWGSDKLELANIK